jgi:glycosyltransferase involved in cell wall biosynthesis
LVFDEPGAWTRYRCDHKGEQLALLGKSFDIVNSARIDLVGAVDRYKGFILNRVEMSKDVAGFLDRAQEASRPVVFDTDDLIFEPELHSHFAFYDDRSKAELHAWIEKLGRYAQTLERCDGVIVSTEPLRTHAQRRNARAEVLFNAVSEEMIRLADLARPKAVQHSGLIKVAYLSGTRTHNRDFLEVADAVLWALETYPQARLLVVGKLDLDSRFDQVSSQVAKMPLQPWQALPGLLADIDVNLAPLERDNPFAACKSCVKYLEAGLLCVPTIASPRGDFTRVIEHGRNGLLAEDASAWREALGHLIESPELRRDVGNEAVDDVREHHTTRVGAAHLGELLGRFRETKP